jgi:hypothetical protein
LPLLTYSAREVRHKVTCTRAQISYAHPLCDPTGLQNLSGALLRVTIGALPARRKALWVKVMVVSRLMALVMSFLVAFVTIMMPFM